MHNMVTEKKREREIITLVAYKIEEQTRDVQRQMIAFILVRKLVL